MLDSLPAGTQALVVRQLGYAPTEVTVELSSRTPARVTVKLGTVRAGARAAWRSCRGSDEGSASGSGFLDRKRGAAGGYFISPEQIEQRKATQFTDLLTTTPGIRVSGHDGAHDAHGHALGGPRTAA